MAGQHGAGGSLTGFPASALPISEAAGSASLASLPLEDGLPTPMLQTRPAVSQVTASGGPGVSAGDPGSFELQFAFPGNCRLEATSPLPSWSQTSQETWGHLGNASFLVPVPHRDTLAG